MLLKYQKVIKKNIIFSQLWNALKNELSPNTDLEIRQRPFTEFIDYYLKTYPEDVNGHLLLSAVIDSRSSIFKNLPKSIDETEAEANDQLIAIEEAIRKLNFRIA